jgi:glycosyltransferase involved in cell wall biosynthesis
MVPTVAEYRQIGPRADRLSGGRTPPLAAATERRGIVSVITPSFNSVGTIDRTIDSVLDQSYRRIEYIVIDGGSRDGTLDRLRARAAQIDLWISEPDRGIADAFNKGVALASGEYVAFVNSDDWLQQEQLAVAVSILGECEADFVFGDLMLHAADGNPTHVLRGEADYARRLRHAMPHLNHPTVVCRRRLYEAAGLFDTDLSIAMDYEWLLRVHRSGARGIYSPRLLGHMTLEGASDRSWRRALAEVRSVSIRYGYPAALAWLRFCTRIVTVTARRRLEEFMPRTAYHRLRGIVNANYVADARGAADGTRDVLQGK